jgi:glycine cleavage system aminomethyltransferase T
MRQLPSHDFLAKKGASFKDRYGVNVPGSFGDIKIECSHVRNSVGVSDFSYMQKFRISAQAGVDFLENIFVGNVAKIRFCRVLHSALLNKAGEIIADCYVANNDEDFIILCESIVDDKALKDIFNAHGAQAAGLEDITDSHVLFSIDGCKAWAVVKELFGSDVLGLPYLSIENYPFSTGKVSLFRAGKTSEFGYMIMAPKELASELLEKLDACAKKHEGGFCGIDSQDALRLEGRFFNIFSEGAKVRDPLVLGLQWMFDFDKDTFIGREAIMASREKGLDKKIIGVKAAASVKDLLPGADIYAQGNKVAQVQAACFSDVLNAHLGLATFDVDCAYAGLNFNLATSDGAVVETISMPPIVPKSLSVKLDEL